MNDLQEIFVLAGFARGGTRQQTSRTFGWYPTEALARAAAASNHGGMDECLFDWLCLEAVPPGIYASGRVVQWYVWRHPAGQEGRWESSAVPPTWAENTVSFTMG